MQKFWLLWVLLPFMARSQETLTLTYDKVACYSGDTIFYTANLIHGNGSRIFYVDLYDDSNQLVIHNQHPFINGAGTGNLIMPQKEGFYKVIGYTKYGNNNSLICQSITVGHPNGNFICRHIETTEPNNPLIDTLGLNIRSYPEDSLINVEIEVADTCPLIGHQLSFSLYDQNFRPYAESSFSLDHRQYLRCFKTGGLGRNPDWAIVDVFCDSARIGRQFIRFPEKDPLGKIEQDSGGYLLKLDTAYTWHYTVAVTDARLPAQDRNINDRCVPWQGSAIDSGNIPISGRLFSTKKKPAPLANKEIAIHFSQPNLTKIMEVDTDSSGRFGLSARFFGDLKMFYNINSISYGGEELRQCKIILDSPWILQPKETAEWTYDTIQLLQTYTPPKFDTVKYLKPVTVAKALKYQLNRKYSQDAQWSEPSPYMFDFRDKADKWYSVWDFLQHEVPGFYCTNGMSAIPTLNGRQCLIVIDDRVESPFTAGMTWPEEIAFVKVIPSVMFEPTRGEAERIGYCPGCFTLDSGSGGGLAAPSQRDPPAVCLYTRKGEDWRTAWPDMNNITIHGFQLPLPWKGPDRSTLLWIPYKEGNTSRIGFDNPYHLKRARIVVEAVSEQGVTCHLEKIVDL